MLTEPRTRPPKFQQPAPNRHLQGQYRHRFKFEKWLGHLKVWLEFYYYQEQAGEEFLFIGYGLQIQVSRLLN